MCRKLSCGELRFIWQERKKSGTNKTIQEWLGGTSAERLRLYGKARADGKSLSRVAKLLAGQKSDFLFIADSGPGDKDAKGLIVPRFGKNPENHVSVSMTWEALAELLLTTMAHYEAWLSAWYLAQIYKDYAAGSCEAAAVQSSIHMFHTQTPAPDYASSSLF